MLLFGIWRNNLLKKYLISKKDGTNAWSLGAGFLALNYVEFDTVNRRIGFAEPIDDLYVNHFFFISFISLASHLKEDLIVSLVEC